MMVLFINVNIGQRVEVKLPSGIFKGTVRFKGSIVTKPGEWVGIELDQPVGTHNGCYIGRRYFQCPDRHGVFVSANQVRFIRLKRRLFNSYRSVNQSTVDSTLFNSIKDEAMQNAERNRKSKSTEDLSVGTECDPWMTQSRRYPRLQAISKMIPAATMVRPRTTQSLCYSYRSTPVHAEYWQDVEQFNPSPTIPKTHMPHSAQKRLVRLGWGEGHLIREHTVNTYRETVKRHRWNDVTI
ncbi:uncharacterized protein LOC141910758 isoform X2 [Tubulanus polymorphus]|uniref:uncharacterized protein LOC141910758 isoform X2 n=1 Tax=Tubulanus polymorphus TaxID=672921 RepID=UPI003DA2255C